MNGVLGGMEAGLACRTLTLELLLGWLFSPLAFLLGVPWAEAVTAGPSSAKSWSSMNLWPT